MFSCGWSITGTAFDVVVFTLWKRGVIQWSNSKTRSLFPFSFLAIILNGSASLSNYSYKKCFSAQMICPMG